MIVSFIIMLSLGSYVRRIHRFPSLTVSMTNERCLFFCFSSSFKPDKFNEVEVRAPPHFKVVPSLKRYPLIMLGHIHERIHRNAFGQVTSVSYTYDAVNSHGSVGQTLQVSRPAYQAVAILNEKKRSKS